MHIAVRYNYAVGKQNNYAFIDAQNVYMGTKAAGFTIDVFKLRRHLADTYHVAKAFWFVGYSPRKTNSRVFHMLKSRGDQFVNTADQKRGPDSHRALPEVRHGAHPTPCACSTAVQPETSESGHCLHTAYQ